MKKALLAALAATAAVAACTSAPHAATVKATAIATASASIPAGCTKAIPALAAARAKYDANDIAGAATTLRVLADSLPPPGGKLKVDVINTALALSILNAAVITGSPIYQDVKDSQAGFDAIAADCPS